MTDSANDTLSMALSAVAHPIRRDMLERLSVQPLTAGQLSTFYAISLPAISKHLKALERAALIERRVQGRNHVLTMQTEGLRRIAEWSARQSGDWAERLAKLKTLMEEDNG